MVDLSTVFTILGLFMLRIGAPVLVLFGLGILIERWQNRHHGHDHDLTDEPDLTLSQAVGDEP